MCMAFAKPTASLKFGITTSTTTSCVMTTLFIELLMTFVSWLASMLDCAGAEAKGGGGGLTGGGCKDRPGVLY